MSNSPSTPFTAVRRWNKPRTKATVILFKDGVEIDRAGGKRAERAQGLIVILQNPESLNVHTRAGDGIFGLRNDLHAAQVEAERHTVGGPRKYHGTIVEFTPVPCVAIPVIEDGE